jgi:hypothetical protein
MSKTYETIYIARYNLDRTFENEIVTLDSYLIEELLGEQETNVIMRQAQIKAFGDILDKDLSNITQITYEAAALDEFITDLIAELYKQSESVSGDDDSYDYFPDLVFAFKQICKATNRQELCEVVIKQINELLEYDEDDDLYLR